MANTGHVLDGRQNACAATYICTPLVVPLFLPYLALVLPAERTDPAMRIVVLLEFLFLLLPIICACTEVTDDCDPLGTDVLQTLSAAATKARRSFSRSVMNVRGSKYYANNCLPFTGCPTR